MNSDLPDQPALVDEVGHRTPIGAGCTLGRSPSNSLPVLTGKVSRRHASIQRHSDDEYWLADLASRNGTYLNGRRLTQPARIFHGDRIRIGDAEFVFEHPGKAAPANREMSETGHLTMADIQKSDCWLLVGDVENSTLLSGRYTEEQLPLVIGEWLERCRRLIEGRQGMINKFLGDGFLAYWPAVSGSHQQVSDCLGDFKAIQAQSDPPFRLALHVGPVYLGGGASYGEESLSGNEVNFVFRMEKKAAILSVNCLLSQAARDRLIGLREAAFVGEHDVPSFEGYHPFYRI